MSGKVVHRFYWDYEKEERWLNEMVGPQLALRGPSPRRLPLRAGRAR